MTGSSVSAAMMRRALLAALREGGKIVRRYQAHPRQVAMKGPVDPVTQADREAERAILAEIKRRFPRHGIVTEESRPCRAGALFQWIIDPLDGTVNYAHGFPHACVSIACAQKERVLMGGILDPFKKELFLAIRGRGATLNGGEVRVSSTRRLMESLLVTGFPYDRYKKAAYYLSFYKKLMTKTQGIRRVGAAALDMAYVACGRFDAFWEFQLKPWDVAAGWLLVEEAGGRVSDFSGRPFRMERPDQTLCSNGFLHRDLIKILSGRRARF